MLNAAVIAFTAISLGCLQTGESASIAVTPQGQLLRTDVPPAQFVDRDLAERTDVSSSLEARQQAQLFAHKQRLRERPRVLAIAALVVLLPLLLAIPQVLLAFRAGRKLAEAALSYGPGQRPAQDLASLPRVTLGGPCPSKEKGKRLKQDIELMAAAAILAAALCGLYFCAVWLALVPGPFLQPLRCPDTPASPDVSPLVAETLRSFCWRGHQWEGVTRREAEVMLTGLERSLATSRGAVLEFGVGVGETTLWISRFLDLYAQVSGEPRRAHRVYDPFQGPNFPKRVSCSVPSNPSGSSSSCGLWRSWPGRGLQELLLSRRWLFKFFLWSQGARSPRVYQGYLARVPQAALPSKVAFAVVDADTYASAILPLKMAFGRLSPYGEMYFHAFRQSPSSPSVREAVRRFFRRRPQRGVFKWNRGQGVSWAVAGPQLALGASKARMAKLGWRWSPAA